MILKKNISKNKISLLAGITFFNSWFGFSVYIIVAAIWFIPGRRIEKKVGEDL